MKGKKLQLTINDGPVATINAESSQINVGEDLGGFYFDAEIHANGEVYNVKVPQGEYRRMIKDGYMEPKEQSQ